MPFFVLFIIFIWNVTASAEYQWGFANVGVNYLDWSKGTEQKSTKKDFGYLEIEGGAQFNWGELYGFFDLENYDRAGRKARSASKGSIYYYLGESKISLYAHVYNFTSQGFAEQNRVVGLGYAFARENFWFKPFLGRHDVTQTYFNDFNGYMTGWFVAYRFTWKTIAFFLADWHEFEFARDRIYAQSNGASRTGHNGALSLWITPWKATTFGLQYRYASDKLGTGGALGAMIYSFKYNF